MICAGQVSVDAKAKEQSCFDGRTMYLDTPPLYTYIYMYLVYILYIYCIELTIDSFGRVGVACPVYLPGGSYVT